MCACIKLQISPAGGRLVIASDGVWDALSSEKAVKCCRSAERAEVAAKHIVKVGNYISVYYPSFCMCFSDLGISCPSLFVDVRTSCTPVSHLALILTI
jgi:hypothetical protein